MRILVELANGYRSVGGGHSFLDVTDQPMLTIQALRPVEIMLVMEPEDDPLVQADDDSVISKRFSKLGP